MKRHISDCTIYEETCNKKLCIDNNINKISNSIHKMEDVEMIDCDNFYRKNKNIICINCGRKNHFKEQCPEPIINYGFIHIVDGESIIITPKYMPCQ